MVWAGIRYKSLKEKFHHNPSNPQETNRIVSPRTIPAASPSAYKLRSVALFVFRVPPYPSCSVAAPLRACPRRLPHPYARATIRARTASATVRGCAGFARRRPQSPSGFHSLLRCLPTFVPVPMRRRPRSCGLCAPVPPMRSAFYGRLLPRHHLP